MTRRLLAMATVLFLSACMATVRTDVEAYSQLPEDVAQMSVFIAPFRGQDASSLQWRANAQTFGKVLTEKGLTVVASRRQADFVAFMGYGVDEGELVTTQYSIPQWGVTGYSGANTYGTVYGNSYTANTTLTPTYGVTGYSTGTTTNTVYTRSFALDIVNNKSGEVEFEGRAISRGACSSFAGVSNEVIRATLSNFPKGKVGKVDLPVTGEC